jgi:tetratricopeptide (TPR) repeat protein
MADFASDDHLSQSNPKPSPESEALSKTAYSLNQKGDSFFLGSRFETAKDYYQKSLDAYRKAEDHQGAGLSLVRLGRVGEILGKYAEARRAYEESLEVFESLMDLQAIARSKAHLGNVCWATGDYAQASVYLEGAQSRFQEIKDVPGQAWVKDLMGNLRLALRQDFEAEKYYEESNALVQKHGASLENNAWAEFHRGALFLFRGKFSEAKERFLEALKRFVNLKDALGQVATLVHLGEIACNQKKVSEAEPYLQKAAKLVLPTNCKPLLADVLTGVAQLLKAQGDERKAIGILMVALSHPTCRQQTKDRMVALAMTLQTSFSVKGADEGFQWAKSVSIEEMASAWLTTVAAKPKSR